MKQEEKAAELAADFHKPVIACEIDKQPCELWGYHRACWKLFTIALQQSSGIVADRDGRALGMGEKMIKRGSINITKAAFPVPFESGLEYGWGRVGSRPYRYAYPLSRGRYLSVHRAV